MAGRMKPETVVILLIFFIGMVLRILMLFTPQDMWHDPAFTYEFSEMPIKYILDSNDVHPPLFYIFTSIWQMFSTDEMFLRSFSIFCYIGFFFALYKYLIKYTSIIITLITLTFISISPTIIFYSLEYRNYALGLVFVIAQVYYFRRYIETKDSKEGYFYILFSLLMLYTHYFTVFLLVVEGLYLLWKHRLALMTIFLEAFILIGIGSIPLIIYFIRTLPKMHSMWFKDITILSFISTLSYQLFPPDTISSLHIIFIMVFVCLWIGSFFLKLQPIFHYIVFFIPVVLVWIISQAYPMYHHRFFLFYSFALYIIIAQVIETYATHEKLDWIGHLFVIGFIVLFLVSFVKLPETLPTELHDSQLELKNALDKDGRYVFIHESSFSQTPMKFYFRDWNIIHYLNTGLTKKERFTAGGAVIQDWEIISDDDEIFCFDACIYIKEKGRYISDSDDKIYYDDGGLIIYAR